MNEREFNNLTVQIALMQKDIELLKIQQGEFKQFAEKMTTLFYKIDFIEGRMNQFDERISDFNDELDNKLSNFTINFDTKLGKEFNSFSDKLDLKLNREFATQEDVKKLTPPSTTSSPTPPPSGNHLFSPEMLVTLKNVSIVIMWIVVIVCAAFGVKLPGV